MRIAFIVRSTLFTSKGGDTLQVTQLAKYLNALHIDVDIKLSHHRIDYAEYDLLHFFNITRPSDILKHLYKTNKPTALSPIYIDYSLYDQYHRDGFTGRLFRALKPGQVEYAKVIARWLLRKDHLVSKSYLWRGQDKSMKLVLQKINLLLPHSMGESELINRMFSFTGQVKIVPNGIDDKLFKKNNTTGKEAALVICAARIEGLKNQVNLVKALNDSSYQLLLIGAPGVNQHSYYDRCRRIASSNVSFIDQLPQTSLIEYYKKAKVHILPSWYEACGLSSLEAAAMGCNVIITKNGFAPDYFGDMAFYCDPSSPQSIRQAVELASNAPVDPALADKIIENYTWEKSALLTADAYKELLQQR